MQHKAGGAWEQGYYIQETYDDIILIVVDRKGAIMMMSLYTLTRYCTSASFNISRGVR